MSNTEAAPLAHPVNAACHRLGVSRTTLYELIASGEIKPIKIFSRTLIPEQELQRYMASRMEAAA